ncbi:hypothetical protein [Pedobacter agri]|uniref:Uncharacterized protein n=1 Tax=Pedobacter agri TaxID=454586 RepID=A0A9X3DET9_9SPHI|nr:hypothetical protein [Pedobacter agri]MCX3266468.1 hypothetical protein [Pedobacter agri]
MFSTTLLPDFRKLSDYFNNLQEHHILEVEKLGGVPVHLEYYNEQMFRELEVNLNKLLNHYNLQHHFKEMLYLILSKSEEIGKQWTAYKQKYNDDIMLKEIATFLLGISRIKPNETLQLNIKPSLSETIKLKNSDVTKWVTDVMYKAVENQDFPLSLFGTQIYTLFDDGFGGNLSPAKMKQASELKPDNPRHKLLPMMANMCFYLQSYLINQTHLTLQPNTSLSDVQANFFFDLLSMLQYIEPELINSEPKDYIYSLLANFKK